MLTFLKITNLVVVSVKEDQHTQHVRISTLPMHTNIHTHTLKETKLAVGKNKQLLCRFSFHWYSRAKWSKKKSPKASKYVSYVSTDQKWMCQLIHKVAKLQEHLTVSKSTTFQAKVMRKRINSPLPKIQMLLLFPLWKFSLVFGKRSGREDTYAAFR